MDVIRLYGRVASAAICRNWKWSGLNFENSSGSDFRQSNANFRCEFQDRPHIVRRQYDDADLSAREILLIFQLLI